MTQTHTHTHAHLEPFIPYTFNSCCVLHPLAHAGGDDTKVWLLRELNARWKQEALHPDQLGKLISVLRDLPKEESSAGFVEISPKVVWNGTVEVSGCPFLGPPCARWMGPFAQLQLRSQVELSFHPVKSMMGLLPITSENRSPSFHVSIDVFDHGRTMSHASARTVFRLVWGIPFCGAVSQLQNSA